jgi:hypothetical protein
MSNYSKQKKLIIAASVLLFLAFAFYSTGSFRHQAFPISQQRIDRESDEAKRQELVERRLQKAREIQREKDLYKRCAMVSLLLAAVVFVLAMRSSQTPKQK